MNVESPPIDAIIPFGRSGLVYITRCLKFVVGLQTRGSKMGDIRGPVGLWTKGPRVMGAPMCAKCSNVCCSLVVRILHGGLIILFRVLFIGRERTPFIDEGDGLTSSRERERVVTLVLLPTLSGTRRFVGAHNTVDVQMHVDVNSIVGADKPS